MSDRPTWPLRTWAFPLLVAMGMGVGTLIASSGTVTDSPTSEAAGAMAALAVLVAGVGGFATSLLTLVVARTMGRRPPRRVGLRLLLSVGCGVALWWIGSIQGDVALAAWLVLLVGGAAVTWPW